MGGPLGGKHLTEYMPNSRPPLPRKQTSQSPTKIYEKTPSVPIYEPIQVMTKRAYEKTQKKEVGHQPWQSSKKMHYLRLSKGRRKPTGQEIAATLVPTQGAGIFLTNYPTSAVVTEYGSAQNLNENATSASSAKNLPKKSKIFTTFGPEAYNDEMQRSFYD